MEGELHPAWKIDFGNQERYMNVLHPLCLEPHPIEMKFSKIKS